VAITLAPSASGLNLTFESLVGFQRRVRPAKLGDARWKIALRFVRRYSSAQSPGSRSQRAAEAHLAGQDRALTGDGVGTNEIMRRTGKSRTCVWRWQERFIEEGFDGPLRDKTRPSRIKPLGAETAERVVALTLGEPPGETTHWTGALMAKATGLSVSSVQRIWRAHGLQPHRVRQFKLSNDPRFVDKLRNFCRARRPASLSGYFGGPELHVAQSSTIACARWAATR